MNNEIEKIANADITHPKSGLMHNLVNGSLKGSGNSAAALKRASVSRTERHNIVDFIDQFSKEVEHKRKPGTLENYRKHD